MSRLLLGDEWFDPVAPSAFYEAEYERVVLQQAPLLYPDYHAVPFKVRVFSDEAVAKPDLALIAKTYREWWVVEIELAHHPLSTHVLPQVSTLAAGYYDQSHAEHLHHQVPALDGALLRDVVRGKPPGILVIVNAPVPEWIVPLRRYNARVAIFEVFRSTANRRVFAVNGDHPTSAPEMVSECHFDRLLPNFLVIESPAALGVRHGETVTIRFAGCVSEWTRMDAQHMVWLYPAHANPLRVDLRYELLRLETGELLIRAAE